MGVALLDSTSLVPYLQSRGVIGAAADAAVEELSGGVSNVVLGVSGNGFDFVLKQALPELKVATKWVADQRRAIVEARAIELFHSLSPNQVPALVDSDPDQFTLVMERADRSAKVWKSELLAGRINPEVGYELGKTLCSWHEFGRSNKEVADQFAEASLFEQLRISPFYREVAIKDPDLQGPIDLLIDELTAVGTTIVHGDFSPKNFLVAGEKDIYILDFEVAHYGNPVFDLAFTLAHLLCKFFRTPKASEATTLRATAARFLVGYGETPADSLFAHTALIALARVEGKSRVDYLDQAAQSKLQVLTKRALSSATMNPLELFDLGAR
ncbi:MAG: phosphotransferase family protein [Holophagaceae bacterium]